MIAWTQKASMRQTWMLQAGWYGRSLRNHREALLYENNTDGYLNYSGIIIYIQVQFF